MKENRIRSLPELKELWISLFNENNINSDEVDNDYQAVLMLIETVLYRTKCFGSNYKRLITSKENLFYENKCKTQECKELKEEIIRLENVRCQKCSILETEIIKFRRKATEADNRMKSIANILKLGDNIQDSQSPRKNSAYTLVSQMLLGDSPKRKKPKRSLQNLEQEHIPEYICHEEDDIIPETETLCGPSKRQKSPRKHHELSGGTTLKDCQNVVPETLEFVSPCQPKKFDKPSTSILISPTELKSSKKANLQISGRSRRIRKNLNSEFHQSASGSSQPDMNSYVEEQQNQLLPIELNGSLAEYVKEASTELDKIWFSASSSKSDKSSKGKEESQSSGKADCILDKTSVSLSPKTGPSVWKLKGKRGRSEHNGKIRLRQMQLSLGHKQKSKSVDVSTQEGYDGGGSVVNSKIDTSASSPIKTRNDPANVDMDEDNFSTCSFNPKATSTQNPILLEKKKIKANSPDYQYKRDAVRKQSDRAKLAGWDCSNCAEYYGALGQSPSKVKGRMNACSRHRAKFKPESNTPPGYWDPIFPDSEECKKKGFYVSIRHPEEDK